MMRHIARRFRQFGLTGLFAALVLPTAHAGDHALIVGINQYKPGSGFNALNCCENDAEQLKDVLTRVKFNVRLLGSHPGWEEPKLINIANALSDVCRQTDEDSTLIVFLSGHGKAIDGERAGDTRSYFCPIDVLKKGPNSYNNLLNIEEIVQQMKRSGAGRKYLFVDACRDKDNSKGDPSFRLPRRDHIAEQGVDIVFSCKDGQVSKEREELQHSVFSYFLIQGMKGKAVDDQGSVIPIEYLYNYLNRKVSQYVFTKYADSQEPDWIPHGKTRDNASVIEFKPAGSSETIRGGAGLRGRRRVYDDVTFTGTFSGIDFDNVRFNNCRFKGCKFRNGTSLRGAIFRDCVFDDPVDFTEIETRYLILIGRKPGARFWQENRTPNRMMVDD